MSKHILPVANSKRASLTIKKRARDAKRWLRTWGVGRTFFVGILVIVCVLFLLIPRSNNVVSGSPQIDPKLYWSVNSVAEAKLDKDSYPPPESIAGFISAATKYIVRANTATQDGRFLYKYTLDTSNDSLAVSEKYNLLRHCGTAYALADSCPPLASTLPHYCKNSRIALRRAAIWLTRTAKPMGKSGAIGLWAKPSVENPGHKSSKNDAGEVRAGGIGLGLIALVSGRQASVTDIKEAFLRDVARAVTDVLQESDGSISSYYDGQIDRERHSVYYPGEAALGLVRLYNMNGNETVLKAAQSALLSVVRNAQDITCDHWMMIATGNLFRTPYFDRTSRASAEGLNTRNALKRHARRVLRACYLKNKKRIDGDVVPSNSYGSSVEAQLNMLPLLAEDGGFTDEGDGGIESEEAQKIWCLIKRTLGSMMAAQFHDGGEPYGEKLDGAVVGRAELKNVIRHDEVVRIRSGFNGEFQIDTTQHTLSAMLAYLRVASHPLFKNVDCKFSQPLTIPHTVASTR